MPDLPILAPGMAVLNLPFKEAIAHLKAKTDLPTERWDQLLGEAHAKAFTVAGATKASMLQDFHTAISRMIEEGLTITDFRKDFDQIVHDNGWSYHGSRGWRSRVIYDTNLRTAHAAGQWSKIMDSAKDEQAYGATLHLQYLTVGDERVRPQHREWNKTILPADHPYWNTHYPPNGWGCRCTVRTLTERDLQRQGLKPTQAPALNPTERINTGTGEVYGFVPEGIDVGWDYNVGKSWLRHDQAGHLPDCNGADHARGAQKFVCPKPGQRTWADLGRPALKDVPQGLILPAPPMLPAPASREEALGMFRAALGMTGRRTRKLETPGGLVVLHDNLLEHLTQDLKRARFAAYVMESLRNPYEVWAAEYPDGIRRHYITLFQQPERKRVALAVTRINTDGSVFLTWFQADPGKQDHRRQGMLIYGR